MLRLLQIEFSKLYHYKAARIFTLLYFALLLVIVIGLTQDISLFGGNLTINLQEQGAYDFPIIWQFTTYVAALFKLFVAIIIITSITQEYNNRTIKQNLIDGLSKKEFILSKVTVYCLFALTSTLLLFIVGCVFGNAVEGSEASMFSEMEYLLYYFIKLMAFFGFCMFMAFLLKRSAFALLGIFVWFIAETIVGSLEGYLRAGINTEALMKIGPDLYSNYLPLSTMSSLIQNPFNRLKTGELITSIGPFNYDHQTYIATVIFGIIYAVLFIFLSYKLIQKRDL